MPATITPSVLQLLDAIRTGHHRLTLVHGLKEFDNDLDDRPTTRQYRRSLVEAMRRLAEAQSADYPNEDINRSLRDLTRQLDDVSRLRLLTPAERENVRLTAEGDKIPILL
jgi:hypothetical protein